MSTGFPKNRASRHPDAEDIADGAVLREDGGVVRRPVVLILRDGLAHLDGAVRLHRHSVHAGGAVAEGHTVVHGQHEFSHHVVDRVVVVGDGAVDVAAAPEVYAALFDAAVYVDGEVIDEPYILEPTTYMPASAVEFPYTVPEGKVFVMGDNRNNSLDSRSTGVGPIDERYILGKAIFRIFPFDSIGGLYGNTD